MSDYPLLPDVESALVSALRASSSIGAVFGDRIATSLPSDPTYPFLTLTRTGGADIVPRWFEGATVELQVWGGAGEEVATAAAVRLARSVVLGLSGVYDGAVVTGVETVLGPRNLGDPETGRPRYIFEVRVFAHPTTS